MNDYPIPSGAPAAYHLGTDDQSGVLLPRIPLALPQHCPQVFLVTQTGPEEEQLVVGTNLVNMYGQESFNPRGKFFNHQTLLATGFNRNANLMSVKRIVPDNAQKAYITIYADVLPTDVVQYERDALTGKIVLDSVNNPIPTGAPIAGYKVKFVANTTKGAAIDANDIYYVDGVSAAGNQVDGATTSVRYPIMTIEHNFKSGRGNLTAIRLWAQTLDNSSGMPAAMMKKYKAYPLFMSLLTKQEETATALVKDTLVGSKRISVTLKDGVYDPLSDLPLFAGNAIVNRYQSISDPRYSKVYGEFGAVKVYTQNIDIITQMFLDAEVDAGVLPGCDFDSKDVVDNQKNLFNFVGGVASTGAQYKTYTFANDVDSISLTASNQIYLASGSDGTITTSQYNQKVRTYMQGYSDENSQLQSYARHPQSDIYDTGFDTDTKMELARFISVRKNTLVHLGTFIEGEDYVDVESELSTASVLQGYLATYNESDYFSTSACRGTLTPGSYKLSNSRYDKRVSLVYERAMKRSVYMGSATGEWKTGFNYDGYPGHLVTSGYDIKPEYTSKTGVMSAWEAGTVFVAQYDLSSWYFPCFRTVYSNDTSILNSDQVVSAIAYVNTVVSAVHRMFQGVEDKSPAELSNLYNNEIKARLKGRFDGKYKVTPQAGFTTMDQLRGYSITVPVLFEGSVMPTVMTTYVVATRQSIA